MTTRSGRNSNEAVAGAAPEAFSSWLHHHYAPPPVKLPSVLGHVVLPHDTLLSLVKPYLNGLMADASFFSDVDIWFHLTLITSPRWCCKYRALSVCLCLSVRSHNCTAELSPIFCACCLWPWLDPPFTALLYAVYFRFYG